MTGKPDRREEVVGPARPLDTERCFVLCANMPGRCIATADPRDLNSATGRPFGLGVPVITSDWLFPTK